MPPKKESGNRVSCSDPVEFSLSCAAPHPAENIAWRRIRSLGQRIRTLNGLRLENIMRHGLDSTILQPLPHLWIRLLRRQHVRLVLQHRPARHPREFEFEIPQPMPDASRDVNHKNLIRRHPMTAELLLLLLKRKDVNPILAVLLEGAHDLVEERALGRLGLQALVERLAVGEDVRAHGVGVWVDPGGLVEVVGEFGEDGVDGVASGICQSIVESGKLS